MRGTVGFYLEKFDIEEESLSNEELFAIMDDHNREEIRNRIVVNNIPLVRHVMNKYIGEKDKVYERYNVGPDDFFAMGVESLIKAVGKFDPSRKLKFSTYASTAVFNNYMMFFRDNKKRTFDVSLNNVLFEDDKGGDDILFNSLLEDPHNDIERIFDLTEGQVMMKTMCTSLKGKDLHVFKLAFIGDLNQVQIAKETGFTQSYVSRILKRLVADARRVHTEIF